jgi:TRAP transporter TAXI family solute receptor
MAVTRANAKFRRFFRQLVTQIYFVVPAILILVAGFFFAYQFVRPAPPDKVVMATGAEDGAYNALGKIYAERFRKEGFELVLKTTAGSVENLGLLADPKAEVPVAILQGGIGRPAEHPGLTSLGSLYFEPIWVFVRSAKQPKRLTELTGKRVSVGVAGSGTQAVALPLLADNGITGETAKLLELGVSDSVKALEIGEIDAAVIVGSATSRTVRAVLALPGVRPMSFERADAYVRRYSYLSKVVLPMGTVDLAKNLPREDVTLLAPTATVVVNQEMHPALVDLMLLTLKDTHGAGGYLEAPGEFPSPRYVTYPLEPAAQRFYERGPPFLQRYMPFGAANLVDRLKVMILPLLTLLYPLFKVVPPLYNWRMRARVTRWYKELEALDDQLTAGSISRAEAREQLDAIEHSVERVSVPAGFAASAYTLRLHIDYLRNKVEGRVKDGDAPPAKTSEAAAN